MKGLPCNTDFSTPSHIDIERVKYFDQKALPLILYEERSVETYKALLNVSDYIFVAFQGHQESHDVGKLRFSTYFMWG